MWPSVHPHPPSPISVCIDFTSAFSSCFCLHPIPSCTPYFYHPHCCCCCCCLCYPVNGTNRPAAARRQTDLLLYLGRGRRIGHRYRIRSYSCSLLRGPPLQPPKRARPVPFLNSRAVSGSSWFDFGYRGEPSVYPSSDPDCRSEATAFPQTAFVSHADHPHRRS